MKTVTDCLHKGERNQYDYQSLLNNLLRVTGRVISIKAVILMILQYHNGDIMNLKLFVYENRVKTL